MTIYSKIEGFNATEQAVTKCVTSCFIDFNIFILKKIKLFLL